MRSWIRGRSEAPVLYGDATQRKCSSELPKPLTGLRRMKGKGIQAEKLQIDWPELMRFKRSFTEPVPKRREDGFAKAGIAAFHGRARFAGPTTVQVGEETLEGRYVVIAAGEVPADLEIPGAEHLTTSDQFLELNELPRRILFIGGGYIAFEFAHVAAAGIAGHGPTPWPASSCPF